MCPEAAKLLKDIALFPIRQDELAPGTEPIERDVCFVYTKL